MTRALCLFFLLLQSSLPITIYALWNVDETSDWYPTVQACVQPSLVLFFFFSPFGFGSLWFTMIFWVHQDDLLGDDIRRQIAKNREYWLYYPVTRLIWRELRDKYA